MWFAQAKRVIVRAGQQWQAEFAVAYGEVDGLIVALRFQQFGTNRQIDRMLAAARAARAQAQRGLARTLTRRTGQLHAIEGQTVTRHRYRLTEGKLQALARQRLVKQAVVAGAGRHALGIDMPHRRDMDLPDLGAFAQRRRFERQPR